MRVTASLFALRAVVHGQRIQRPANRTRLLRIEGVLEPTLKAAERMFRLCIFLADYIDRQLVIFDELHTRSVSRGGAA